MYFPLRTAIFLNLVILMNFQAIAGDSNPPIDNGMATIDFSTAVIGSPTSSKYSGSIVVDKDHKINLTCMILSSTGVSQVPCRIMNGTLSVDHATWAPYETFVTSITFDPPAVSVMGTASGSIGLSTMSSLNQVQLKVDNKVVLSKDNPPSEFSYPYSYFAPTGISLLTMSGTFPTTVGAKTGDPNAYYYLGLNTLTWTTSQKSLTLSATYLDSDGVASGVTQTSAIKNNDTIVMTLGSAVRFQLFSGASAISYRVSYSSSPSFKPAIESDSKPFYENVLAIIFGGNSQAANHDLMAVHSGTQQVTITPSDSSISPVVLNLVVSNPTNLGNVYSCGSYVNCDDLVLYRAQQSGLAPQFIKGLIYHESTFTFDEKSYRYEPRTQDLYHFSGGENFVNNKVFNQYIFKSEGNTVTDAQKSLRAIYNVVLNRQTVKVPNNFEAVARAYLPAKALAEANPKQNWGITSGDLSGNKYQFPAQTVAAASYGLMHILYSTAITDASFTVKKDGISVGDDPVKLLDAKTNAQLGVKILKLNFADVNQKEKMDIQNFSSVRDYTNAIRNAFAGYNGGRRKYSRKVPQAYADTVVTQTRQFAPAPINNIFSH